MNSWQQFQRQIQQQWRGWMRLVLQSACPLCQRSTSQAFCQDCQRQLQRCQLSQTEQLQANPLLLFAWGEYTGSLRRAIAALKYENNPQLARPMGHWMAQAWLATNPKPDAIILPIPMHSSKQQKRGFNQAELLAESFCDYTRLPLELAGLERSRETTAQFGLTAADRAQNLAGAFTLGKSFLKQRPTQSVLLLDDIYTTGATVKSAIVTLRQHGIRVQGVIVLAKTLTTYPNR